MENKEKVQENKTCGKPDPLEAIFTLGLLSALNDDVETAAKEAMRQQTEIRIDTDHVSIPVSRFEQLLRAEADSRVLLRAYQTLGMYRMEDVMASVFGPKPVDGAGNAQ